MDTQHVAVDPRVGQRTFSWARFAVMMVLIGTPCIACAWLLIRQTAPDRAQAGPAAAPVDSRPLVVVIQSPSAAAPRNTDRDITPAPSHARSQPSAVANVAQPPVQPSGMSDGEAALVQAAAIADADAHAAGKPACLSGSVIQTAATNPVVAQLPPVPGPTEVSSARVDPAPALLPPVTGAAPVVPAAATREDSSPGSTGATAAVALPTPDEVQLPSPSVAVPAPASGPEDAKQPQSPKPALELPAPNLLPVGMPPNHPMPSSVGAPPADMPQPTEEELEAIRNHVEGIIDPRCTLDLVQGRTRVLKLKTPARSVHVSGTEVINCTPVNGREIAIQARAVGTAVLHLAFGDGDQARDTQVRYLVRVAPALTAREPYEAMFRALEGKIAGMFAGSKVQLNLVGDAVIVTGQVREARDATAIVQLVVANTPWADRHAAAGESHVGTGSGSPHVINRLQIARAAQRQVALRVAVVELSRSALWTVCGKGPVASDTNHSAGAIVPVVHEISGGRLSALWAAAAFASVKPADGTDGRPTAEPRPAEPRHILLYGQPATVVASGQCLVTAAPDTAPAEQRPVTLGLHGVELSFTPVGVDGESVRMMVAGSAGSAGRPGTGRRFRSTIPMREGQPLAFVGVLPPGAGDRDPQRTAGPWSVFGRLAGLEQPTAAERETIILILPEAAAKKD